MPKAFFTIAALVIIQCAPGQIVSTDYSLPANWSAGIMKGALDMQFNPSFTIVSPDTLGKTIIPVSYDTSSGYDLFCVYPTLILGNDTAPSTQPINVISKASADLANNWFISEFAQFGRVYSPYYRQANLVTFNASTPYAVQAPIFDTAVTDVMAAFDYYMQHYNNGKKVILLGYSQGAVLLGMLLRKLETNNPAYLNKIFLSVLIGMESGPFVLQNGLDGGWWQTVPICQDSTDTACVMSWDAHKYGQPLMSLIDQIPFDTDFVSLNFMYKNFDTSAMHLYMDHLGFDTVQKQIRFSVYPASLYQQVTGTDYNVTTGFIGFTDMYYGNISNPDATNFGFMMDRIPNVPDDNRIDPLRLSSTNDLHVYDPYVNIGDVICLIYEKMGKPCPYNFDSTATAGGINDVTGDEALRVMPNPCYDNVHLVLPSTSIREIVLYDLVGEVVSTYPKTSDLNLSGLAGGVYIISVKGFNKNWQQRIIKLN